MVIVEPKVDIVVCGCVVVTDDDVCVSGDTVDTDSVVVSLSSQPP